MKHRSTKKKTRYTRTVVVAVSRGAAHTECLIFCVSIHTTWCSVTEILMYFLWQKTKQKQKTLKIIIGLLEYTINLCNHKLYFVQPFVFTSNYSASAADYFSHCHPWSDMNRKYPRYRIL